MAIPSSGYASADWTNPASDLTDFVGVVDLSDLPADFWTAVSSSDGARGRVAKDDGTTELASEWVEFDDVAETGFVFFKWSGTLASTGTSTVRIYPPQSGNSSYAVTATFGRNAVWSDYLAVFHLTEDPTGTAPQFVDATGSGNDGTATGTFTSGDSISGKLGNAISLSGSNRISVGDLYEELVDYSISVWARADSASGSGGIVGHWGANRGYAITQWTNGEHGGLHNGSPYDALDSGTSMSTTNFDKMKITFDGTNRINYVNGSNVASDTRSALLATNEDWEIGAYNVGGNYFAGDVDEVRLKEAVDSADWESLEHSNQDNPTTFWGTWTWNAASGTTTLSGNDLSATAVLDQSAFQTITMTGNELSSSAVLDQSSIPVTLSGNALSSATVLDQSTIQTIQLIANGLNSSTVLDQSSIVGAVVLSGDDLVSATTLDQGSFLTFTLSANNLSSVSTLEQGQLAIVLSGDDLGSLSTLDQSTLRTISLNADDLSSTAVLQDGSLIIIGDATKVDLQAKELYTISLEVNNIYNISLQAKEQYTINLDTDEVIE